MLETAGLPAGASVTVVRDMALDSPGNGTLLVGTAGHGMYRTSSRPSARVLPVVLDVVGATGARFLSELVIGSRAASDRTLPITYTPAPGFAGPGGAANPSTASVTIPAGREIRASDALAFLRSLGIPIPVATPESAVAGSLTLAAGGTTGIDDAYLIARTYTRVRFRRHLRLLYGAPSDLEAAEEEARSTVSVRSGDFLSNLAAVHLPGRGTDAIEVSVQVYSASGPADRRSSAPSRPRVGRR